VDDCLSGIGSSVFRELDLHFASPPRPKDLDVPEQFFGYRAVSITKCEL